EADLQAHRHRAGRPRRTARTADLHVRVVTHRRRGPAQADHRDHAVVEAARRRRAPGDDLPGDARRGRPRGGQGVVVSHRRLAGRAAPRSQAV
ncbi:MAG: hypothetical protein AVDCRST_MAG65-699, partial [uncultured Solirubrobacteraceae bacterium]